MLPTIWVRPLDLMSFKGIGRSGCGFRPKEEISAGAGSCRPNKLAMNLLITGREHTCGYSDFNCHLGPAGRRAPAADPAHHKPIQRIEWSRKATIKNKKRFFFNNV
jgi:hypothetical protein